VTVGSGLYINLAEKNPLIVNTAIKQLIEGRSNAVGTVTLTTGITTTVTAVTCGPQSAVFLFPTTANAAAAVTTVSVPSTNIIRGQFIVNHASNANTDKIYNYLAIG
jgi:hypothetical protein